MKLSILLCTSAVLAFGASVPVQAQSLLGGLLGGSSNTELLTLGSGDAGTSGLVNVGVGGNNQLLDANVGGNLASATVGASSGSGVGGTIGLLDGAATPGLGVGGTNLASVDIGIGGGGGGPGGPGGPCGPGAPGVNGNGGLVPGGALASAGGGVIACQGVSSSELERLILSTRIDRSWGSAHNVDIRKISVCPELRAWLAAALRQTGLGQSLRSAIVSDELLTATLNRSPHSADRVFAVQRSGSRLTVFVY
jgi:hypothetical protein